jgi:hypothetical protein
VCRPFKPLSARLRSIHRKLQEELDLKQITLRDAEGGQPQIGMGMDGIGNLGRRMSARSLLKQALGPGEI